MWLKIGKMKKETEGLLIRTNVIKTRIDKSHGDSKCRMCKEADETVTHIICQCRELAQKEYKNYDNVPRAHWELCKKNELRHELKW